MTIQNNKNNLCHVVIIALCASILGLMSCLASYAADQTAADSLSASKEQKLQEIYNFIDNRFGNLRTNLNLSYIDDGMSYDALSIDYRLVNRSGCTIKIDADVNANHTEKYAGTDNTKCYLHDLYCNTVDIDMRKLQSINITLPLNDPSYPKIFYYNRDILNGCIYINFKASNDTNAFKLNQNKHVREYLNTEHHEYNKHETDDIPKEISRSFSTYSMCISDEKVAERLARAFNDYRTICVR